jgi:tetratricopeptide (TPR) repeat protein
MTRVAGRSERKRRSLRGSSAPAKGDPQATSLGPRPFLEGRLWMLALVGAFAIKVAVLAQLGEHPLLQPQGDLDTTRYIELARKLAAGGPLAVTEPFYLSPLYVYFLAAVFSLSDSLTFVKIVQILLGTLAAGLLYLTAREWFGQRAAGIALVLFVLTGLFTFYEVLVLQAALDPFLAACSLYFVSRAQRDTGSWAVAAAGATLGLFALNRPNALAYGLMAAVFFAVDPWRRAETPSSASRVIATLRRVGPYVLGMALVLAPNALRNYAVSGEIILVSSHGGLNFYIGNGPGADGTYSRVSGIRPSIAGQAEDAMRLAEEAEGRPLSSREVSSHFYRHAWDWIAENPISTVRLFARKVALLLNRENVPLNYSYAYYREESTLLRLLVVGPWLLVPLGLYGLFLPSVRTRQRGFWAWAAFVPVYGLSVAAFFVSSRYRMPLLVPLSASSGAAVAWILETRRDRNHLALAAGAGALILLFALSNRDLGLDDGRGGEQTRKAVWLVEQGRYEEAHDYVERISSSHSHPGVLRFQVGKALATAGRYREAIESLGQALEIDGDQAAVHLELGQLLMVESRPEEAVSHLRAALDAGFRPEISASWLLRALAAAGRKEEAVSLLEGLPDEIGSSGGERAFEIGTLALSLDAPSQAERWLSIASAQGPSRADVQENLGVARLLLGRPGDALPALETACRLAPERASARLNLAVVYAQLGRFEEARIEARKAAELDPGEARAVDLLKKLGRN